MNKLCSNSLLHSPPNATRPTHLCKQGCHPLRNFLFLILPRSTQQDVEEVDVEVIEGAFVQNLPTREAATLEPHSQILLDMADSGQGCLPPISGGGGCVVGVTPLTQQNMTYNAAAMYLNIIKRYANLNVCFLCGFDVEDGHTSKTCPVPWRRANHQEGFD